MEPEEIAGAAWLVEHPRRNESAKSCRRRHRARRGCGRRGWPRLETSRSASCTASCRTSSSAPSARCRTRGSSRATPVRRSGRPTRNELRLTQHRHQTQQVRQVIGQLGPAVVARVVVLPVQIREQLAALVVVAVEDVAQVQRRDRLDVERARVELLLRPGSGSRCDRSEVRAARRRPSGTGSRGAAHASATSSAYPSRG